MSRHKLSRKGFKKLVPSGLLRRIIKSKKTESSQVLVYRPLKGQITKRDPL